MNILMIAYRFPPASESGSFRPMYFAYHLQNLGENVCVLTVREQDYLSDQTKDYNLLKILSNGVEIIHSRAFRPREAIINMGSTLFQKTLKVKDNISIPSSKNKTDKPIVSKTSPIQWLRNLIIEYLSIPDAHIGWLPSSVRVGLKVIKNKQIDVIYATGGPWTSLLIGAILRKITQKPLIIDFRDPWLANPFYTSKNKLIRSIESSMERKVIAIADHIITNTEELKQDFLVRYPFLSSNKLTTIPNGFEEYIELESPTAERYILTFTHAGALYFSRNPRYLLQAIFNLIEQNIIPKQEMRFVFLGGIDDSIQDQELQDLLQHPLLQGVIDIVPRLPYQEALKYQSQSDILLLIQPDFPLQVPRKLYEYMAFRKPILGITDSSGATARIIQTHHIGIVVENQISAIETALKTFYQQWKKGTLSLLATDQYDVFMNKNLTLKLQSVFQKSLGVS